MKPITATVSTSSSFEATVKLDSNGQEVKAVSFNGIIKSGTRVLVMGDDTDGFYIVNTFKDGMDEVVSILNDFLAVVEEMKIIDNSAFAPAKGLWGHDKIGDILSLKSRLKMFLN